MEIPWIINEQTKVKHNLLNSYIKKWAGILYNQQVRMGLPEILVYIDGFAGPGLYWNNEAKENTCSGSPVIVAKTANQYIDNKPSRRFIIIGIDKSIECVQILQKELNKINRHNQYWKSIHAEFDNVFNSLLNDLESKKFTLPPMFVFIDPFGFSGFPMNTLKRILKYERAELFINFIIYDIIRFLNEREEYMNDLFACTDFKEANEFSSSEKKQNFLINLYCKQLKDIAKAEYVMPFRINTPNQGTRPKYYLIHASKHIKALKEMKDSMAKHSDCEYKFEAIGLTDSQFELFENPDKIILKERLIDFLKNGSKKQIEFTNLENWAYANTNGIKKTIQNALIELEKEKIIEIERHPRQRKSTVTEGAIISVL